MRVRRTGKAINAPMLAATIGIDRAIKGNIRRGVTGENRAAMILFEQSPDNRRMRHILPPTIIEIHVDVLVISR